MATLRTLKAWNPDEDRRALWNVGCDFHGSGQGTVVDANVSTHENRATMF
jgi:hypothetical protein